MEESALGVRKKGITVGGISDINSHILLSLHKSSSKNYCLKLSSVPMK